MVRRMVVVVAAMALLAADGGGGAKAPPKKEAIMSLVLDTTVCYVLNQRTKQGQWARCSVHELLPDGGTNPDGGAYRR